MFDLDQLDFCSPKNETLLKCMKDAAVDAASSGALTDCPCQPGCHQEKYKVRIWAEQEITTRTVTTVERDEYKGSICNS